MSNSSKSDTWKVIGDKGAGLTLLGEVLVLARGLAPRSAPVPFPLQVLLGGRHPRYAQGHASGELPWR